MSKTNTSFDMNIDESKENERIRIEIIAIDTLIIILALLVNIYVFGINEYLHLKILFGAFLCIVLVGYVLKKYEPNHAIEEVGTEIRKLILLGETGERTKEWLIQGETSLLIGKTSNERGVDIDLSGTQYASLISHEHAVLNCVSDIWYIEDLDSINGIGMEKRGKSAINKLKHESPYRVSTGDVLYIANTRIMVE